jgi:thioredoxin 2
MVMKTHIVCPACNAVNGLAAKRDPLTAKCGKCGTLLFSAAPTSVGPEGFELHVARNDLPVLVDVWAPWCGPCRQMTPMFERAARELEPHVRLVKLNADEAPEISRRFGIRGIPTLLLLHRGRLLAQSAGVMDTQRIVLWARAHLPNLKETSHDAR